MIEAMISDSKKSLVVIDEVQKLPSLLDEAHRLIEEKKIRFLLTGSSARKLKRGQANLLAGRAITASLFPLTAHEIPDFKLDLYLYKGGLPAVWQTRDSDDFFESYVETYLKEEVLAEQAARSLPHYSRFLKTAALCSGELVNFSQVASDAHLPVTTVKNYFEVLQDTLVGQVLEPWVGSKKRKAILTAKFYFFDIGVRNWILDLQSIPKGTDAFGKAFEHFIFMELRAYLSYSRARLSLYFWRSVNHHEVDFLLGDQVAIEVKSKTKVTAQDAKNLKALQEEGTHPVLIVVSQDPINRKKDGVSYLHWKEFLERLWAGKIADGG
jgi:predicted AAA+ superfamily ATPase